MEEKKVVTLDLTGCKYLGEIHQRIKQAFDFPDFYGENWDAFWDLLNEPRENTVVMVYGLTKLPKKLESSGKMIVDLLEENKVYYDNFMRWQSRFERYFDYKIVN